MNKKNSATPKKQGNATDTVNTNIQNIRAVKRLRILLHILNSPQGVSEKSINIAAKVMSGRNYPTKLKRQNDIQLVYPIVRLKDSEGCPYSLYQLLNAKQAHKLVKVIIQHCSKYNLDCPEKSWLSALAERFPDRSEIAA